MAVQALCVASISLSLLPFCSDGRLTAFNSDLIGRRLLVANAVPREPVPFHRLCRKDDVACLFQKQQKSPSSSSSQCG
ncbi:unnamed protein product [Victoria cruziana]